VSRLAFFPLSWLKLYLKTMFNMSVCSVFIAINYGIIPSFILGQLLLSFCVVLVFFFPSVMGASLPLLLLSYFKLSIKVQKMYLYH